MSRFSVSACDGQKKKKKKKKDVLLSSHTYIKKDMKKIGKWSFCLLIFPTLNISLHQNVENYFYVTHNFIALYRTVGSKTQDNIYDGMQTVK